MEKYNISKEEAKLELIKRKCKVDFWSYCLYMNKDLFKPRENPLKKIANSLCENMFLEEKKVKIYISIAPRTGKSILMTYFITWVFFVDKNNSVIRATYSQKLSNDLTSAVRQILHCEKYKRLINFNLEEDTQTKLKIKGSKRTNLISTSVGGSTTGFGANIIISDDLYKDFFEASSEATNKMTKDWYFSALKTRQDTLDGLGNPKGQLEILIGTRWTPTELVQGLLDNEYFDYEFVIPALNEDGKSFNENIYKTSELQQLKKNIGDNFFEALYQQKPILGIDSVIDFTKIKQIQKAIESVYFYDFKVIILDLANEGDDDTVALCLGIMVDKELNYNVDLISSFGTSASLSSFEKNLKEFIISNEPTLFLAENNFNDIYIKQLCDYVQNKGIKSKYFRTIKNKHNKIIAQQNNIEKVNYILDLENVAYNKLINQIKSYSYTQKLNKHDDYIDCLSMGLEFVEKQMRRINPNGTFQ